MRSIKISSIILIFIFLGSVRETLCLCNCPRRTPLQELDQADAAFGRTPELEKAADDIREPDTSKRLNISVRGGVMRLAPTVWKLAPCAALTADITLSSNIFASANGFYGAAAYGTPENVHLAFGDQAPNPTFTAFAITFGIGYRTAPLSLPALYASAGAGIATYHVPIVPLPGQAFGIFGWEPNTVPFVTETSLAVSIRGGFEYPFTANNRIVLECGIVRNLGKSTSHYFIPITAGISLNI